MAFAQNRIPSKRSFTDIRDTHLRRVGVTQSWKLLQKMFVGRQFISRSPSSPLSDYPHLYGCRRASSDRSAASSTVKTLKGSAMPSTYLHKSAYFGFGEVGWTTAFVHSNGAAVWLYALTNLSIASRNCLGDVKLTPLSACWPRMLNQHST